jgi:hypothetical protein
VIRVVDLRRVRAALSALDALVARFPRLRRPVTGERLAKLLDDWTEEDERGDHGEGNEETERRR